MIWLEKKKDEEGRKKCRGMGILDTALEKWVQKILIGLAVGLRDCIIFASSSRPSWRNMIHAPHLWIALSLTSVKDIIFNFNFEWLNKIAITCWNREKLFKLKYLNENCENYKQRLYFSIKAI